MTLGVYLCHWRGCLGWLPGINMDSSQPVKPPVPDPNWAQRFDAWARRNPALVLLGLLALIVGSVVSIGKSAADAWPVVSDPFLWTSREEAKLHTLSAGMSVGKFEETLGSAVLVESSQSGDLTEKTYRGRGYWAQVIHDRAGTVKLYAVTACRDDFHPIFEGSLGGTFDPQLKRTIELKVRAVLGQTRLSEVGGTVKPTRSDYYLSGATAPSYLFDIYSAGNPSNYKTYVVGWNGACGPNVEGLTDGLTLEDVATLRPDNPTIAELRTRWPVNTFAETDANSDPDDLSNRFVGQSSFGGTGLRVGPDRIRVRVLPEQR
jgi:hypothetical protein